MLTLLALLISSLIIDVGLQRSSFSELQILCGGLDNDCGSSDNSSESIDPVEKRKKEKIINMFEVVRRWVRICILARVSNSLISNKSLNKIRIH